MGAGIRLLHGRRLAPGAFNQCLLASAGELWARPIPASCTDQREVWGTCAWSGVVSPRQARKHGWQFGGETVRPNHRASLDAAFAFCFYIESHWRGASEHRATAKVQGGDSTSLVAQSLRELARALAGWFGTIALVHSAKIRWADQPGQKPSVALRRVAPAFLGWRLFQVCRWSVKRRIKVQG